ncbi:hypothetical protein C0995_000792 [Termitomyces sp. Mi166|nr:hypothetical protein C0995_000792 [Termitomyces sp. Mi166\
MSGKKQEPKLTIDDEQLESVSEEASQAELERLLEEKRLVQKLDRRILPIACLLYLFAYLDRSNLGNARLQGLDKDILGGDKTGILFDWVNSIFFFSYILCQVPATVVSKLFPPRVWMASSAVGWGISSTLMATAFGFGGMMTARLFLGIFEAGFGPAIPLYFSLFYTTQEMGLRMAYWFGFAAVAGAFGGLLAFGVQHVHANVENWRLLFLIEGIPAVLLGALTLLLLPNRPESTTYLTEREREIAVERMNRATSGDTGAVVNRAHVVLAFKDWRIYVGGVIYFGLNCALASISAFLPTILTTLGYIAHNLGSETKKATGIPMFMAIGQCGSVLGSHIYPKTESPAYTKGFAIGCALEFLAAVCCFLLSVSYRIENARRDRIYGKPDKNARVDTHELADGAPDFRYLP